jgi:hypothetical protein
MDHQDILDRVRVASPCTARWEDMTGNDRARFCQHCQKHVFNLSAMTRAEAETLVREKEGKFCGRLHRRRDGRLLTADCPTGKQRLRERLKFFGAMVVATLMFLLTGCRRPVVMGGISAPPGELGEAHISQSAGTNPPPIMGDIAVPLPPTNTPAK